MNHLHLPQPSTNHPSVYPIPNPSKTLQLPKIPLTLSQITLTSKTSLIHQDNPITTTNHTRHHHQQTHKLQTKLYNTKIKHHLQKGHYKKSISLYYQMLDEQISPNSTTFALLLNACSCINDLKTIRLVHNDILRFKFGSDDFIAAALVKVYSKCGHTDVARQLFEKMPSQDVVSWTAIIRLSSKDGQFDKAIRTFRRMVSEGVAPDSIALVSILSTVTGFGCLRHGTEVHGYLIRKGFKFNQIVIGSLVNMYSKLGKPEFADRIVDQTVVNNVVVWTAMMGGLIRAGNAVGAVTMFEEILNSGVEPTEKTISCVLSAASQLGSLHFGIQIHGQVIKRKFSSDLFVMSGLMNMYAKCGANLGTSRKLFDEMQSKDTVLWTAMISAHGLQGEGHAALHAFDDMKANGIHPDSVTFTSVLSACSFSGMLVEGLRCFHSMIRDYKIKPREEHHACLMDLFAKDGRLEEACELIESMDLGGEVAIWKAFLGACRVHGDVGLGEFAATRLMEIENSKDNYRF